MIFSLFFASQIFFMFIFHFNRKAFKSHKCNKEPDSVVPILNLKRKCFFPLNSNKFQHNPRSYLLRQNNSFNAFLVKILILGASGLPFSFTLYRPLIWPKLVINWPSPPEWSLGTVTPAIGLCGSLQPLCEGSMDLVTMTNWKDNPLQFDIWVFPKCFTLSSFTLLTFHVQVSTQFVENLFYFLILC